MIIIRSVDFPLGLDSSKKVYASMVGVLRLRVCKKNYSSGQVVLYGWEA